MKKIKVYLIARIPRRYHISNRSLCRELDERFVVFIPQMHNPFNIPHQKLEEDVARVDFDAINQADLGLVNPPFGADCSCEIGYFSGIGKPVALIVREDGAWRNIWMAKSRIDLVIAMNKNAEKIARQDKILRNKLIVNAQGKSLSDILQKFMQKK